MSPSSPNVDEKAALSLVLGLLSLLCLGPFAGVPAIVLGTVACKDIDRTRGAQAGSGLAISGIITGATGTIVSVIVIAAILMSALQPQWFGNSGIRARAPIAASARVYGTLEVIDLDDRQPLSVGLADVAKNAAPRGRTVILQTYVRSSRECADVASALDDPRMQKALANVTLVRVDVDTFETELRAMRIDTETVPWFYMLDGSARPTDAISADEWDENRADNMAPVLDAFMRGTLSGRRGASPLGTSL
ncbi:MAG: DUF4190 domain-containing protein [Polyangiaceae bacterium]|nr:DUF4190 domain-containing protein [Polyangiaceae bacterium]